MTVDELIQIANAEHWKRGGEKTWQEIAEMIEFQFCGETLRKRVRRAEGKLHKCNGSHSAPMTAPVMIPPKKESIIEALAQLLGEYMDDAGAETEELESVPPRQASIDDTEQWEQWKKEHPEATILFLCDIHIPDHNEQALRLVTKLGLLLSQI